MHPVPSFHYHPIANQLFFGLTKSIFGLNPLPFHLLLFFVFICTLFVIFRLARALGKSPQTSLLAVFFWATNVSLFANFYWTSISYFVFGPFFIFLTGVFFLENSKRGTFLSLLFFTAAILSNELALVVPVLLAIFVWFLRLSWRKLIPALVLGSIFLFLKIFWIGFPTNSSYRLAINKDVLATAKWYVLRSLNLPEGADRAGIILIALFVIFLSILLISFWFYFRSKKLKPRFMLFCLAFFIVGALPFFFLPGHMSSYYLTVALFGPALIYAETLNKKLLSAGIIIYILLTIFGLQFLSETHWIILKNTGPIGQFSHL